jgi:hypothetical protein
LWPPHELTRSDKDRVITAVTSIVGHTLYREFVGMDAVRPGESKRDFLARYRVGTGPPDPARMPYYLLIVADLEVIPFAFQHQLDVKYAVGRLHFDTVEEYGRYARSVVEAETRPPHLPRRAVLFATKNADDPGTALSTDLLAKPLADLLKRTRRGWDVEAVLEAEATKSRLGRLLGGDDTPGLLFTACQGMAFPLGHEQQRRHQGAIVCQEWPGPVAWGRRPMPEDQYFSADDLGDSAHVHGLIAFLDSSFSAAVPH